MARFVLLADEDVQALRRLLETLAAVGNPLDCLLITRALDRLGAAQIVSEDGELTAYQRPEPESATRALPGSETKTSERIP